MGDGRVTSILRTLGIDGNKLLPDCFLCECDRYRLIAMIWDAERVDHEILTTSERMSRAISERKQLLESSYQQLSEKFITICDAYFALK